MELDVYADENGEVRLFKKGTTPTKKTLGGATLVGTTYFSMSRPVAMGKDRDETAPTPAEDDEA